MHINQEIIRHYQELVSENKGISLTEAEAEEEIRSLFAVFSVLIKSYETHKRNYCE